MKLNLYMNNVFGIYLETYAVRLTSVHDTDVPFVFAITEHQQQTLKTLLLRPQLLDAYVEIERLALASGLDIPLWLLAEPL